MSEIVLYQIIEGVAIIKLNRPEKYNAIIEDMAKGIQDALVNAKKDDEVRSILLCAEGKAFCAGQDLKEFIEDERIDAARIVENYYNPIVRHLVEIEKPVVCAVQGVAAGAGANLALACDIVIAGESAQFIQAFCKIALIPDTGGTYLLPRLIGLPKAKALAMLGESISARYAERIGMIYQVVPDEDLDRTSQDLAKRLAAMPTKALGIIKRAMHRGLSNDLNMQLDIEAQLQAEAISSLDFKEGVAAFIEKRSPQFVGK